MNDDYPTQGTSAEKKEKPNRPTWTPELWVLDDCSVRECIDGFIHYEDRGYVTVARCPRCNRGKAAESEDIAKGIPIYTGRVSFRSQAEMEERRKDREKIAASKEERAKSISEIIEAAQEIEPF